MTRLFAPPPCPGWRPPPLDMSESSGTVIIHIRGSLDARTAREVRRSVVSQTARTEIEAVEIDLRRMDSWTTAGLLELGSCAGRRVRFRMGPNVARVRQ